MAGLALGIVLIILITGQPEPSRNSGADAAGSCRSEPGSAARLSGAASSDGSAPGARRPKRRAASSSCGAALRGTSRPRAGGSDRGRSQASRVREPVREQRCPQPTAGSESARKRVDAVGRCVPVRRRATSRTPSLDEIARRSCAPQAGRAREQRVRPLPRPARLPAQQPRVQRRRPTGTHA